jgi:hypothetical protein
MRPPHRQASRGGPAAVAPPPRSAYRGQRRGITDAGPVRRAGRVPRRRRRAGRARALVPRRGRRPVRGAVGDVGARPPATRSPAPRPVGRRYRSPPRPPPRGRLGTVLRRGRGDGFAVVQCGRPLVGDGSLANSSERAVGMSSARGPSPPCRPPGKGRGQPWRRSRRSAVVSPSPTGGSGGQKSGSRVAVPPGRSQGTEPLGTRRSAGWPEPSGAGLASEWSQTTPAKKAVQGSAGLLVGSLTRP